MMSRWIHFDERADHVSGRISFVFLGITQAGLVIAIFVQRYLQGLPPAYYNDLAIVLGVSLLGFWLASFYLGGVLPVLKPRTMLAGYLFLVLSIGVPHTLIRGLPQSDEWGIRLLVIFGAPALLVGGYAVVAYLGSRRLDRMANS